MATEFVNTAKQQEIMRLVLGAADNGYFIGLTEIHDRVSYGKSVGSPAIQCSMRFLIKHDLVERIRIGRFSHFKPTSRAYRRYRAG